MFFQSDEDSEDKWLYSRLNDVNRARLMRIAIEGPQLSKADFNEIIDILKETSRHVLL